MTLWNWKLKLVEGVNEETRAILVDFAEGLGFGNKGVEMCESFAIDETAAMGDSREREKRL